MLRRKLFSSVHLTSLLVLFFWGGWPCGHSAPNASILLQEQIRADLTAVRHFIDTAINFANHPYGNPLQLSSLASEKQTLVFIEKLSANNTEAGLVIDITFQSNEKNPRISPLLAGKTIQFIGLDEQAHIAPPPSVSKASFSQQHHLNSPPPKKPAFAQTLQNLKKKLKKIHHEKALQHLLEKTQEQLQTSSENTSDQEKKDLSVTQKEDHIAALSCTRLADKHGQFFAIESTHAGSIDLFARLPAPYNACQRKKS